ncbi:MAG: PilZ domain-containing protein [Smithella sp.]
MTNKRIFERYGLNQITDTPDYVKVSIEGQSVRLVDLAVGGMYVLSMLPISLGQKKISINIRNRDNIDMSGNVVRVMKEGEIWGIGIDFLIYKYNMQ